MIRRPPRSTRTDTLFPYTTLFRAVRACPLPIIEIGMLAADVQQAIDGAGPAQDSSARPDDGAVAGGWLGFSLELPREARVVDGAAIPDGPAQPERSEEGCGGKECVSTGTSGWSPVL